MTKSKHTKRHTRAIGAPKHEMIPIMIRVPKRISEALETIVDGIRYRSRAQLINVILDEWLKKNETN